MPTQLGTAVNFGFVSTSSDGGLTATGLTGFLLQSSDIEGGADKEQVRANQGNVVSENYYDPHLKASLRFVISASSKANSITATSLASFPPGTIVSITACASQPDLVNTHWIVQAGGKIVGDVTKSAEFTLPLESRAGITAAQS